MVSGFVSKQTEAKETMTEKENKSKSSRIKALMKEDEDLLRSLMRTALQEVMEAEMSETLGAGKGERSGNEA